jgi:hypothetical protein
MYGNDGVLMLRRQVIGKNPEHAGALSHAPPSLSLQFKCHIQNLCDAGIIFHLSIWISMFATELRGWKMERVLSCNV